MTDDFRALINRYRARMAILRETFDQQGYLFSVSTRNPNYSLLLTRNSSSESEWRVTSFDGHTPIGHREYDHLDGAGATQNAFGEFAGTDLVLTPRPRRRAPSATPMPT